MSVTAIVGARVGVVADLGLAGCTLAAGAGVGLRTCVAVVTRGTFGTTRRNFSTGIADFLGSIGRDRRIGRDIRDIFGQGVRRQDIDRDFDVTAGDLGENRVATGGIGADRSAWAEHRLVRVAARPEPQGQQGEREDLAKVLQRHEKPRGRRCWRQVDRSRSPPARTAQEARRSPPRYTGAVSLARHRGIA